MAITVYNDRTTDATITGIAILGSLRIASGGRYTVGQVLAAGDVACAVPVAEIQNYFGLDTLRVNYHG